MKATNVMTVRKAPQPTYDDLLGQVEHLQRERERYLVLFHQLGTEIDHCFECPLLLVIRKQTFGADVRM